MPECRDVNAGSFHVALTNQIGKLRAGFIADITRDLQVWNQPVYGYTAKIVKTQTPSPGAAPGTVSEAVIHTEMLYGSEVQPAWEALNGTPGHGEARLTYNYRVELNAAGEIIGGEWLDFPRPDFLWIQKKPAFSGYYRGIGDLEEQATEGEAYPDPTRA